MKLLFTSDWHLDAKTAGAPRRQDLEAAAHHVVDRAIALHQEATVGFVFGGDLCDPHRASSCYASAVAVACAMRLHKAGVPSLWLTGNHDVVQDGTGDHSLLPVAALGLGDVTVVDRPDIVQLGEANVLCLPYPSTATEYDPAQYVRELNPTGLDSYDTPAVAVGHLALPNMHPGSESLEMPRGRDLHWPLQALREYLPSMPLVAAHYHKGTTTADGVLVIGSLGRLTFADEAHEPAYLLLEVA